MIHQLAKFFARNQDSKRGLSKQANPMPNGPRVLPAVRAALAPSLHKPQADIVISYIDKDELLDGFQPSPGWSAGMEVDDIASLALGSPGVLDRKTIEQHAAGLARRAARNGDFVQLKQILGALKPGSPL